ncbi:Coatomer subunit gamma [Wickerhamiella sorbophila]|uniref:Coatomer subunit gamma n=1 Tax=Wickerhamiella sorbophila TaxID=45607 RepID=A0A2T0FCW3_9ASCO|nr:Coatomer subunit gamma [Wickerhamiella sorbophila]PRT52807.1 Coatomer subunit gamma [Wickerhamiella sorbophila]
MGRVRLSASSNMSVTTYKQGDAMGSDTLDKMTVYQNCIASFNSRKVSAREARSNLSKLLKLLYHGETFPQEEATELFYTISKLFQKPSPGLRQSTYLVLRELRPSVDSTLMLVAAIMKDVQGGPGQVYRPDALRTLVNIVDESQLESIDRLMRMAIVDKDGSISSAALVSAYHLLPISKESVRRWTTEIQEALHANKVYMSAAQAHTGIDTRNPQSAIVQYHALGLLYRLRSHDRMALLKMIQDMASASMSMRSPQALVLLIRFIAGIVDDDPKLRPTFVQFLESWLKHRSDMVNIEAAKAILGMSTLLPAEATAVVDVLRVFLGSPRAPSRFAAVRLLNRFAMQRPDLVASCNSELENLITDRNESVAIYAITALLKTGTESSVERLIEQVGGLMNDIADDLRAIVVDAIRSLALKFPAKHRIVLTFFAEQLEHLASLSLKTTVVDALTDIMAANPESRDEVLSQLADFIEDCEFPDLMVRVLHVLGQEGPLAANPTQYVRAIYNRVVLENSLVRAAAVSALGKFVLVEDHDLQQSLKVLLRRCLNDETDEVRDRAALALGVFDDGPEVAQAFFKPPVRLELVSLEDALLDYMSDPSQFSHAFDASSIRRLTERERKSQKTTVVEEKPLAAPKPSTPVPQPEDSLRTVQARLVEEMPEFSSYGNLLHTSAPQSLTEDGVEYQVVSRTHVYGDRLVVQLEVQNTFEMYLENVEAVLDFEELELACEAATVIEKLPPHSQDTLYVIFERASVVLGAVPLRLRFIVKEDESDPDAQEEEYEINDLELLPGDYITPSYIGSFDHQWDELPEEETVTQQLPAARTLPDAVSLLSTRLGLMAVDGSDAVEPDAGTHTLKLFGRSVDGVPVAAMVRLLRTARSGVAGKFIFRSNDADLLAAVAENF